MMTEDRPVLSETMHEGTTDHAEEARGGTRARVEMLVMVGCTLVLCLWLLS